MGLQREATRSKRHGLLKEGWAGGSDVAEAHYRAVSSWCCWCETGLQLTPVKGKDPPSASAQLIPGNHQGWSLPSRGSSSFPCEGKKRKPAGFEEPNRTEKGATTSRDQSSPFGNTWAAQAAASPRHRAAAQPPSAVDAPAEGAGLEEKASSPDSGRSVAFTGLESHFCSIQRITASSWWGRATLELCPLVGRSHLLWHLRDPKVPQIIPRLQGQALLGGFLQLYQKCPRGTAAPPGLAKTRSCRRAQKPRALQFYKK